MLWILFEAVALLLVRGEMVLVLRAVVLVWTPFKLAAYRVLILLVVLVVDLFEYSLSFLFKVSRSAR